MLTMLNPEPEDLTRAALAQGDSVPIDDAMFLELNEHWQMPPGRMSDRCAERIAQLVDLEAEGVKRVIMRRGAYQAKPIDA